MVRYTGRLAKRVDELVEKNRPIREKWIRDNQCPEYVHACITKIGVYTCAEDVKERNKDFKRCAIMDYSSSKDWRDDL